MEDGGCEYSCHLCWTVRRSQNTWRKTHSNAARTCKFHSGKLWQLNSQPSNRALNATFNKTVFTTVLPILMMLMPYLLKRAAIQCVTPAGSGRSADNVTHRISSERKSNEVTVLKSLAPLILLATTHKLLRSPTEERCANPPEPTHSIQASCLGRPSKQPKCFLQEQKQLMDQ